MRNSRSRSRSRRRGRKLLVVRATCSRTPARSTEPSQKSCTGRCGAAARSTTAFRQLKGGLMGSAPSKRTTAAEPSNPTDTRPGAQLLKNQPAWWRRTIAAMMVTVIIAQAFALEFWLQPLTCISHSSRAASSASCKEQGDCRKGEYCDSRKQCYRCSYIKPSSCDALGGDCCSEPFYAQCPTNPHNCTAVPPVGLVPPLPPPPWPADCARHGGLPPGLIFALALLVLGLLQIWLPLELCLPFWTAERLQRKLRWPCGKPAPPDAHAEEVPIYCDTPERLAFGTTCLGDENVPKLCEDELVTMPMFLTRCMSLCIPFETAGEQQRFDLGGYSYPFCISFVANLRKIFELLQTGEHGEGIEPGLKSLSLSSFARLVGGCNFDYGAAEILQIAAALGIPDEMAFVDSLVLMVCLSFPVDGRTTDSGGIFSLDIWGHSVLLHAMGMLVAACEVRVAAHPTELLGGALLTNMFSSDFIQAVRPYGDRAKLNTIRLWYSDLVGHDAGDVSWADTLCDRFKSIQQEKMRLPYLVDVVLEFFAAQQDVARRSHNQAQKHGNTSTKIKQKMVLPMVHAAKAHFEAAAGSLDAPADPNALLDLMYGQGALRDDERARARALLGIDEQGTIHYHSWLLFAVRNEIQPSHEHAVLLLPEERADELPRRVVRNASFWSTAAVLVTGLGPAVLVWKNFWYREVKFERGCKKSLGAVLAVMLTIALSALCGMLISPAPWFWTYMGILGRTNVPPYVMCAPLPLLLAAIYFAAGAIGSTQSEPVAPTRAGLMQTSSGDSTSGTCGAMLWQLARAAPSRFDATGYQVLFWLGVLLLTVGLDVGFVMSVLSPWGWVQHTPEYWEVDRTPNPFLLCVFAFFAFGVIGFGAGAFAISAAFYAQADSRMSAVDRLITSRSRPLDVRHPGNLVVWCRLRDCARQSIEGGFGGHVALSAVASVSVAWAAMGGLISMFWFYVQADWTPFRVVCAWYAIVGGAAAAMQVLALVLADGAVKRTQLMLEEQLEKVTRDADMARRDDGPRNVDVDTLQSAADGIRTELDVYRLAPERRFFSLFGMPVGRVFVSVSTLVLGQAAAYGWTALKQAVDDGSRGDYVNCTVIKEFREC
eukprot:COSAG04_NODE_83_length_27770_cov_5.100755_2_plen_1107_part_00